MWGWAPPLRAFAELSLKTLGAGEGRGPRLVHLAAAQQEGLVVGREADAVAHAPALEEAHGGAVQPQHGQQHQQRLVVDVEQLREAVLRPRSAATITSAHPPAPAQNTGACGTINPVNPPNRFLLPNPAPQPGSTCRGDPWLGGGPAG